jgi:hypothetical protein
MRKVKLVLDANLPMKMGLIVAGIGILLALAQKLFLKSVGELWAVGFAAVILGAMLYLAGRVHQLWKRRY